VEINEVALGAFAAQEMTSQIGSSKKDPAAPEMPKKPAKEISSLAQIAIKHDLLDFSYNSQNTHFAYYKDDQSLAMRASSSIDIHSSIEKYSFDLTFSAESLGLTAKDFEANAGKPFQFKFSVQRDIFQSIKTSKTSLQKTLRKPEDILHDLAKALTEVMKDKGNKSVSYELDEEARQALMGDSKMIELLGELVMMMSMINMQKSQNNPSNDYTISISGKGKPMLNVEDHTQVEHQSQAVEFSITIQPPPGVTNVETNQPISSGEV
jgi:hypothetical protein